MFASRCMIAKAGILALLLFLIPMLLIPGTAAGLELLGIEVYICSPCGAPPAPIPFEPGDSPINVSVGSASIISTFEFDADTESWSGETLISASGSGAEDHGTCAMLIGISGEFRLQIQGTIAASGEIAGSAIKIGQTILAESNSWVNPSVDVDVDAAFDGDFVLQFSGMGGSTSMPPRAGTATVNVSWTITPLGENTVYFWEGLSGDFADETNWDPEGVPGMNDLAIFDRDQAYTVTFGDVDNSRAFVERGYVVYSGGSYTLGGGSLESPSLIVGNDAAGQADLLLMYGHRLETTFATLGRQSNNRGTLQVSAVGQPTHWLSQGRLTVGESGHGTVQVVFGGTMTADEVILGRNSGSEGHFEISAPGSPDDPPVTLGSVAIGLRGLGSLRMRHEIEYEGFVPLVAGHVVLGQFQGSFGGVSMTDGWWQVERLVIGDGGGGVFLMDGLSFLDVTGDEPTVLGFLPTSTGDLSIGGAATSIVNLKEVVVGWMGQGQIAIGEGSLLATSLFLGSEGSAEGVVQILESGGILGVNGPVVVGAGSSGANRLSIGPGSQGIVEGDVFVGVPPDEDPIETAKDAGSGQTNLLQVEGGQLTIHAELHIGGPQLLDSGLPTGTMLLQQFGIVDTAGLIVNGGGAVMGEGAIELTGGTPAIVNGTIAPGVMVWEVGAGAGEKQAGPQLRRDAGFASLTIDGDLELTDGGVLELSVGGTEPGQVDQLIVSGGLVLGEATLQLNFVDGYGPQAGDALQFVSVGGAFDGTFAEVVITGLAEGFEYDLDLDGGEVVLVALNDATVGIEPGETLPDPEPAITALRLHPNMPNPFNPQTVLVYEVPQPGAVRLEVFDLRGRLVRNLVQETRSAGRHEVLWDGRDDGGREQPSGVYLSRLRSSGREVMGRMTLVR
jgi:T5SS/PEP-CTERM-associated repeat protein